MHDVIEQLENWVKENYNNYATEESKCYQFLLTVES